ncbi:MAG: HEPN domain-containing protein [Candidatus Lokiarchaeota archaeon]|nr:HEPN domain-containing protein [Candidatus Lokiarchaeota archaeon]
MSNNERYSNIWFMQAKYDLEAAQFSKENGSYEWACFQAQQSGEKALKAFLFLNRRRNVITHSIRKLIEECGKLNEEFLELKKAKVLDQYYIPTRYPNGLPDEIPHEYYSLEDGDLCVTYAQKIIQLVGKILQKV